MLQQHVCLSGARRSLKVLSNPCIIILFLIIQKLKKQNALIVNTRTQHAYQLRYKQKPKHPVTGQHICIHGLRIAHASGNKLYAVLGCQPVNATQDCSHMCARQGLTMMASAGTHAAR